MNKAIPADRSRRAGDYDPGSADAYLGPCEFAWDRVGPLPKSMAEVQPTDTVGDIVRRLAEVPLKFQPGSSWDYGAATDLLGHVVEVITRMTLDHAPAKGALGFQKATVGSASGGNSDVLA